MNTKYGKRKKFWPMLILMILTVAIIILVVINGVENGDASGETVSVVSAGSTVAEFSMEDIKKMPAIERETTIVSGSAGKEHGVFRGVALADIINAADDSLLDNAENVNVGATDGFVTSFSAALVSGKGELPLIESGKTPGKDNVILAYEKDGKDLGNADNGGSGPFRIIVADDQFGNRCAKYVNSIEVE